MIQILVVDDHFVVRMGLAASLNAEPDLAVIGEASTAQEALELHRELKPDMVIMDWRLPDQSGAEATAAILREFPQTRVLMLSMHLAEENVYLALRSGVQGFVLKSVTRDELLAAVRAVAAGRKHLDPAVAQALADKLSHDALTDRELQVLRMVVQGLSNKEIAAFLKVAEVTVKQHLSRVFQKLDVADRTRAATVALKRGIVQLD